MKKPTLYYGIIGVAALMLSATPVIAAYAQGVFESRLDNFRISNLPADWVVEDGVVGKNQGQRLMEATYNFQDIGAICKATQAVPAVGGNHDCERNASGPNPTIANPSEISITKFPELRNREEFVNVQTPVPTDILSVYMTMSKAMSDAINPIGTRLQFAVVDEQDVNIRITSTNQTVPAKLATLSMTFFSGGGLYSPTPTTPDHVDHMFGLFTVSPDGNTGYSLVSARWDAATTPNIPPELAQIMQSFELVS